MNSLILQPQTAVQRKVSIPEYYHAASGASRWTLETPRNSIMVVEGRGALSPDDLALALRRAADANPGARMRLIGRRQNTRWTTDGAHYPHFRVIDDCTWYGESSTGAEFIEQTPLPLQTGPIAEIIFARGKKSLIIFRVSHAAMDGLGMVHFIQEIFRVLRGEPLLGSNAEFSDVDLMRAATPPLPPGKKISPLPLTGGAQGYEFGDVWRRLTLPLTKKKNVTGLMAELSARFAHRFMDGTVRIAVPVNLRRHCPGLISTMNFTGMLHVDIDRDESAEQFRAKLHAALEEKRDASYHPGFEWLRYLPLSGVDFLTGRRRSNYLQRKLVETVLITNFGVLDLAAFHAGNFVADNFYSLPVPGNAFISLYASGPHTNIIVGMPRIYACGGRMDEFCEHITRLFN